MNECKECGKALTHFEGRRKKEFCNSTCRSKFWQKSQKNIKSIQQIVKEKNFVEKREGAFVDLVVSGRAEVKLESPKSQNPPELPKSSISEEKPQNDMPEELVNQIIAIQTQKRPTYIPEKKFKSYKQKQIDELMKTYKNKQQ